MLEEDVTCRFQTGWGRVGRGDEGTARWWVQVQEDLPAKSYKKQKQRKTSILL